LQRIGVFKTASSLFEAFLALDIQFFTKYADV